MSDLNRRDVLQILGATPAAVAITWNEAEAAQAAQQSQQARKQAAAKGQAYKPRFFTAREYAVVVALVGSHHPQGRSVAERLAGRHPRVHRSHRQPAVGTPDGAARRAGVARYRVPQALQQGVSRMRGCRAPPGPRRHCLSGQGEAGDEPWRPLLHDDAGPGRVRLLVEQGRREGFGYIGNVPTLWHGAPEAVLSKLGVSYE